MLTKQDIKEIINSALDPVAKDILLIKTDVSTLKTDVSTIKQEITKLRKAEEIASKYFDTVTTGHAARIKTMERNLGISAPLN